jgi:diguanylate cyclase (GGDEF)-like protein/PAS domain S-box-containing protein
MKLSVLFQWRSLKTRVTAFTLAIFLISIWLLAFYTSGMLRQDIERMLGEQQFSTASFIAAVVDQELIERLRALEKISALVGPAVSGNPDALQGALENYPLLQNLFNAGVVAYQRNGTAIAEVSLSSGRLGTSYIEGDAAANAIKKGKSTIGHPVMDRILQAPVVNMAVPLRDSQGQVIGALAGIINLGQPNFLDKIAEGRFGKTGYYLLSATQHRLVIASSDKRQIMQPLPAPGTSALFDRYDQGYEGYGMTTLRDVEILTAAKRIPVADWFIGVGLPAAEAMAPIHVMQRRMLLATVLLTLLAGSLTWWIVRRQLSPLLAAATTLTDTSQANRQLQPLAVTSQDEIGELINGFNCQLEAVGQREALLKQILDTSSVAIFLVDTEGCITQANQRMAEMFGCTVGDLEGKEYVALVHPAEREISRQKMRALLASTVSCVEVERLYSRADDTMFWGQLTGRRFYDVSGVERGLVGVIADITKRKQAEEKLRITAVAFESQQAMLVTDADGVIVQVNRAFTESTGYTPDEAIGYTPRLLHSGCHNRDFYREMRETIRRTGGWQGEIWDRRKNGEVYPTWLTISTVMGADGAISHYIGMQHDITERKKAEQKIETLAFFDQLTGLPNRTLLLDRLTQAITISAGSDTCGALLFIDLDHFKKLNDTLGHDKGDLLLQQVAQRLVASVREVDTVARLGGDEFVVVLGSLNGHPEEAATQTKSAGEKILAALSTPYQLNGTEYRSSASIGATLFYSHPASTDDLLKQADLAMTKSKETGRNGLRFFDPAMQTVVIERAALETGLRRAIQDDQLILHYQAQVVEGGRVTGAEALVRWQHPERGMVSPAEFIPLAEETGLILPLGNWVLTTACIQLARWAILPEMTHLTLAVNVSVQEFAQPDFVDKVMATINQTGANPGRLKLELTESMLANNVEDIIQKMFALKARGVGFSLDDFGTGYSSLTYLKRLPLDQLKIDQSFVRDVLTDPNDTAIVRTIIALAHSLGLGVIAEGVETGPQMQFLASSGCHAFQGYYFGRPLPAAAFEAFARGQGSVV